jgi:hypothetical protein
MSNNKPRKTYRIVPQDSGFAVEVRGRVTALVTPFATEAEAHAWILEQRAAEDSRHGDREGRFRSS